MKIVNKPSTENFSILSSHRSESAAKKAANQAVKSYGTEVEILYQAAGTHFEAVWHVMRVK